LLLPLCKVFAHKVPYQHRLIRQTAFSIVAAFLRSSIPLLNIIGSATVTSVPIVAFFDIRQT
jgi:hypothetical protein